MVSNIYRRATGSHFVFSAANIFDGSEWNLLLLTTVAFFQSVSTDKIHHEWAYNNQVSSWYTWKDI